MGSERRVVVAAVTCVGATSTVSEDGGVAAAVVERDQPTALAGLLEDHPGADVVLVAPARWGRAAALLSAVAAGRHPGSRVATVLAVSGPLAVREGVLASATAVAGRGLGPAGAAALVEAVLARSWSGAWLPAVARLSEPAPSLAQHVRSWLPGGEGFLAVHAPRPGVHSLGGDDRAAAAEGPARVVASGVLPEAARRALAELLGAPADVVDPAADPRETYGTARAVEVSAVVGTDLVELAEPLGACPVCEEPVRVPLCPLCRVRLRAAEHRAEVTA